MNYFSGPSHLGDCLWTLHALRRIGGHHRFYVPETYHPQLHECIEETEIELLPHENVPADAKCTWIGCQRFQNQGVIWALQSDLVTFLKSWNNCLCRENGNPPLFTDRQSMLFDFPAIQHHCETFEFDVLVINCRGQSGQCHRLNYDKLDSLIQELGEKHRVLVTNSTTASNVTQINNTVCQIGNIALRAKLIVAVASGASWGVHSIWHQQIPTMLFLDDPIKLDYGRPIPHHGLVSGMRQELVNGGWL